MSLFSLPLGFNRAHRFLSGFMDFIKQNRKQNLKNCLLKLEELKNTNVLKDMSRFSNRYFYKIVFEFKEPKNSGKFWGCPGRVNRFSDFLWSTGFFVVKEFIKMSIKCVEHKVCYKWSRIQLTPRGSPKKFYVIKK